MELLETYAPAFGLLGTVIGLVYMLSNLKDPSTIGQGLALALLTTFYGLIISNMIFTPLASRLRYLRSKEEVFLNLTEKAIIFMLDGISPRIIKDSLIESLIGKNGNNTTIEKNKKEHK
jgi:chemotaxis protein MotA